MKKVGGNPILISVTEYPKFKDCIDKVPVDSIKDIPEQELKDQFRKFLEKLKVLTEDIATYELSKMDPKEIIKKFFDPEGKLYKNIEMVMQTITVCAVKHSCESVLESFVSKYENQFDSRRNTEEAATNEEFEIATNGPNISDCDSVVREAMDLYWKGEAWHFFRSSIIEKLKTFKGDSQVMDRMMNVENKFPFMS